MKNKKPKKVEKSVAEEIIEALGEFTEALEKGNVFQQFNCRHVTLNVNATPYGPEMVKKTRNLLGMSQPLFARFLGVSPKTVKSWEQGLDIPHPMACRFMDEIRENPKYWLDRFKKLVVTKEERRRTAS